MTPFRNCLTRNARRGAFRVALALAQAQEHSLTGLLVGPHMRVRLQPATVHTPALGVSTSASSPLRRPLACIFFKGLSSERRLSSHHGPGIALPPTSGPRCALRRGRIAAMPQRACVVATCNGWPIPHSPRQLVTEMRDGFRAPPCSST